LTKFDGDIAADTTTAATTPAYSAKVATVTIKEATAAVATALAVASDCSHSNSHYTSCCGSH
jgi:hypothetical protein